MRQHRIRALEVQGAEPPHVLGNRDAPVTLEEFGDFECGACGSYYQQYVTGTNIPGYVLLSDSERELDLSTSTLSVRPI